VESNAHVKEKRNKKMKVYLYGRILFHVNDTTSLKLHSALIFFLSSERFITGILGIFIILKEKLFFVKKFFTILLLFFIGIASYIGFIQYSRYEERKARRFHTSISTQWKGVPSQKKSIPPEIASLLNQPYFFLGQGKQTFVFESADGTCVLKLFKHTKKKYKKLKISLLGAYLASTLAQEETGLLFCSINGLQETIEPVTILTKKGKTESIDLTQIPFLLQKRATPLKQTLLRLKMNGNVEEARARIQSIFHLLTSLREKELVDCDGSLIRKGNIGYIGDTAVLMDTGKLCVLHDKTKITLHDLNRLRPLISFCEKSFPEIIPTLEECMLIYKKSGSDIIIKN
jgi:hypothetical protein